MSAPVLIAAGRLQYLGELLSPALALANGAPVTALALPGLDPGDHDLFARGLDRLLFPPPGAARDAATARALLEAAADRLDPVAVLLPSTALGAEVAARFAQRRTLACANEADELAWADGGLRIRRRCMGRFVATDVVLSAPAVATVRPRLFTPPEPVLVARGETVTLEVALPAPRVRLLGSSFRHTSEERLDEADRVVSVGRGLKTPDHLPMIRALADVLGAAVAGSRPITEQLRWLPLDLKVGLSGATIAPDLYIACGISGQIEHVVGMRESRVVVAINTDPAAPIFAEADYCVVGDLHDIVPALTEAVRSILQT
jgi:electron transfer flavoprotein alpha subunit